jgi:hypothetical protein
MITRCIDVGPPHPSEVFQITAITVFRRALYLQTPNFKLPMAARDMEKDTEEEHVHFQNVIAAFQQYARYTVGTLRPASPPQAFT